MLILISITGATALTYTDNLTAYWKFDETSGTTAVDYLLRTNGTLGGNGTGATFDATGKINYAVNFGTTSNAYNITFPASSTTTFNYTNNDGNFTMSMWWYKDSNTTAQALLDNTAGLTANKGFILTFTGVSPYYMSFKGFAGGTTQWDCDSSSGFVINNAWNHIAVAGNTTHIRIYINGVNRSLSSAGCLIGTKPTGASTYPLVFGVSNNAIKSAISGKLDEVGFWNRELNQTEISYLYASGSPGTNQQPPFGVTPTSPNFQITLKDKNTSQSINNFSVNISSSSYTTTNGTIITSIYQNASTLYNISFWDINTTGQGYFNTTALNINVSTNYQGEAEQFILILKDKWSQQLINGSIIVGSSTFAVTNGSYKGTLGNQTNTTGNFKVDNETYFNQTFLSYSLTTPLLVELIKAYIDFNVIEKVSGATITTYNFTLDGVTYNQSDLPLAINTSSYNVTIIKPGYYNSSQVITPVALAVTTFNYELNDAVLNITLKNAWNNASITNFTGWLYNSDYAYNTTFSTTMGSALLELKKNINYTLFIDNENYSINETTNYKNFNLTSSRHNETMYIYTSNSIRLIIRSEQDSSLITQNVSILATSDTFEENYSTSTGYYLIENLTDNIYSLRFTSAGYNSRSYSVTVASRSTQELTAYLTNSNASVIFTIYEEGTSTPLEGARVSMYAFISGNWSTIESKLADITGKVQLIYVTNNRYRFIVSMENYTSKTFELNPVLYSDYNIRLTPLESFDVVQPYAVGVNFLPKYFYSGSNNFTIFFNSPEGRLSNYAFNITYPNSTTTRANYTYNGSNAIGETHSVNINIIGAEFLDVVTLNYSYTLVGGELTSRTFTLPILNVTPSNSFMDNINNDYGLTTFEKLLIFTLTILLVGGVTIIVAGSVVGGAVTMFLTAYFGYMGFIPTWSLAIVIIAGITFLLNRENV